MSERTINGKAFGETKAKRASALWDAIVADSPTDPKDTHRMKLVSFPRKLAGASQLFIRPLTIADQIASASGANATALRMLKGNAKERNLGYERIFTDSYMAECLYRACRNCDDPKYPAFPSPAEIASTFTADETLRLFEEYRLACIELGPARDFLPATGNENEDDDSDE